MDLEKDKAIIGVAVIGHCDCSDRVGLGFCHRYMEEQATLVFSPTPLIGSAPYALSMEGL